MILSLLRERTFRISVKSMRPPIRVSVFAWRMGGNSCVLGGGDRWGQLRVFGADSGHVALKGMPREKAKESIKGEELMVAPFAKKVYVINGDTVSKTYSELGLENGFGSGVDEKADEIEEWMKLN